MKGKQNEPGSRSQNKYSQPHHSQATKLTYKKQSKAYVEEVNKLFAYVHSTQDLDSDD